MDNDDLSMLHAALKARPNECYVTSCGTRILLAVGEDQIMTIIGEGFHEMDEAQINAVIQDFLK